MCRIELVSVSLQQQDSNFYVEADMLFVCQSVGDDASLLFVPVLSDGEHRLELPLVLVAGKRRYRSFKMAMWGISRHILQGYKILKVFKAVNPSKFSYPYKVCVNYEDWMAKARIGLFRPG